MDSMAGALPATYRDATPSDDVTLPYEGSPLPALSAHLDVPQAGRASLEDFQEFNSFVYWQPSLPDISTELALLPRCPDPKPSSISVQEDSEAFISLATEGYSSSNFSDCDNLYRYSSLPHNCVDFHNSFLSLPHEERKSKDFASAVQRRDNNFSIDSRTRANEASKVSGAQPRSAHDRPRLSHGNLDFSDASSIRYPKNYDFTNRYPSLSGKRCDSSDVCLSLRGENEGLEGYSSSKGHTHRKSTGCETPPFIGRPVEAINFYTTSLVFEDTALRKRSSPYGYTKLVSARPFCAAQFAVNRTSSSPDLPSLFLVPHDAAPHHGAAPQESRSLHVSQNLCSVSVSSNLDLNSTERRVHESYKRLVNEDDEHCITEDSHCHLNDKGELRLNEGAECSLKDEGINSRQLEWEAGCPQFSSVENQLLDTKNFSSDTDSDSVSADEYQSLQDNYSHDEYQNQNSSGSFITSNNTLKGVPGGNDNIIGKGDSSDVDSNSVRGYNSKEIVTKNGGECLTVPCVQCIGEKLCACALNNNVCDPVTSENSDVSRDSVSEQNVSNALHSRRQLNLVDGQPVNNGERIFGTVFPEDEHSTLDAKSNGSVTNGLTDGESAPNFDNSNLISIEYNSEELDGSSTHGSDCASGSDVQCDIVDGCIDKPKLCNTGQDSHPAGELNSYDSNDTSEKPRNSSTLSFISSFLKRKFLPSPVQSGDVVLVSAIPLADVDHPLCDVNQNSLQVSRACEVAGLTKDSETLDREDPLIESKTQICTTPANQVTDIHNESEFGEGLELLKSRFIDPQVSEKEESCSSSPESSENELITNYNNARVRKSGELLKTSDFEEEVQESWSVLENIPEKNSNTLVCIIKEPQRRGSNLVNHVDAENQIFLSLNNNSNKNSFSFEDSRNLRRFSLPCFLFQSCNVRCDFTHEIERNFPLRDCRSVELGEKLLHYVEDHLRDRSVVIKGTKERRESVSVLNYRNKISSNCRTSSASLPDLAEALQCSELFQRSLSVTSIVSARNYSHFDSSQLSTMGNIQGNEGRRNPKLKEKDRLKITKGKSSSKPSLLDSTDTLVDEAESKAGIGSVAPLTISSNENKTNGVTEAVMTRDEAEIAGMVTDSFRKAKQKVDSEAQDSTLGGNRNSLSHKTSSSDSLFTEAPNSLTASIIKENKKAKKENSTLSDEVPSPTDSIERKFETSNNTSLLEVLELTNNLSTASCLPAGSTSCLPFRSTQSKTYNSVSPSTGGSLENGLLRSTLTENTVTKKQEISRGAYSGSFSGRESPPYHPNQVNNPRVSYLPKVGERVCATLDSCANSSTQPSSFESASETLLDISDIPLSSKPDSWKEKREGSINLNAPKELSREITSKPKRFLPSVPSLSPPSSPVSRAPDHILEDDEHFYEVFLENSSNSKKVLDHDRSSGLGSSLGDMPQASAGRATATTFRVTRHKKVDLQPASGAAIAGGVKTNSLHNSSAADVSTNGTNASRDVVLDSNVLRKVASLTLEHAVGDKKQKTPLLPRPKLPPEKLEFRNRHTFEGHTLVSWLLTSLGPDHYLRPFLTNQDLRLLCALFCSHLLAAGVLRPVPGDLTSSSLDFRNEGTYCWGSGDTGSWPPSDSSAAVSARPGAKYTEAELQQVVMGLKREHREALADVTTQQEEGLFKLRGQHAAKLCDQANLILDLENETRQLKRKLAELQKSKSDACTSPLPNGTKSNPKSPTRTTFSPAKTPPRAVPMSPSRKSPTKTFPTRTDTKGPSPAKSESSLLRAVSPTKVVKAPPGRVMSLDKGTSFLEKGASSLDKRTSFLDKKTSSLDKGTSSLEKGVSSTEKGALSAKEVREFRDVGVQTETDTASGSATGAGGPAASGSAGGSLPPPAPSIRPPPPPPGSNIRPPLPPPPPGSGIRPPPPPPGSGIRPPPPPPGSGIRPPPPPPGSGIRPPPPPPGSGIRPPPPPPGSGVRPPPPPPGGPPAPPRGPPPPPGGPPRGPPPPPGSGPPPPPPGGPTPFPAPPPGGWNASRPAAPYSPPSAPVLRKTPVNPKLAMRPLYWTRIQLPPDPLPAAPPSPPSTPEPDAPDNAATDVSSPPPVWDSIQEEEFDEGEFVELFARTAAKPKAKQEKAKVTKLKVAKVLDSKRSQNVGIFITSQHLDIAEVENAVYNLDTSSLDLEVLQQIYEVRGTTEELQLIQAQVASCPELPLDKPEQFLLELSRINEFSERISCLLFRATFSEDMSHLHTRVQLLLETMQQLMTSQSLKRLFGLILALGNYMNGGNRQRGQADGFGLEILPKLKDVKSSQNSFTLLHFIVIKYIQKYEGDDAGTDKVELPTPDPYVAEKVANIKFEDLEADLNTLTNNLKACQVRVENVAKRSDKEHLQPFQDRMAAFLETANTDLKEERKALKKCQKKFEQVVKYFQFSNRGKPVTPYDFFSVWSPFCRDFMTIWQMEQRRIVKERMRDATHNAKRLKTATCSDIVTKAPEATGLKSKLRSKRESRE